jgi:hypothetical protein
MIGELLFALLRFAIYFFIFYFFYRVIVAVLRGLKGEDQKKQDARPQEPSVRKPVQTYSDVAEAKFKDIPPDDAH